MIIGVMLAVILEILDTSIVNVALPTMMGNLGATVDEISWVATSYIVANVIVIPMTSFFAARFGRRRYFVGSILLFTFNDTEVIPSGHRSYPRVTRTWWARPSSTRGTRVGPPGSVLPSNSTRLIPRCTPWGFSTAIS